MCYISHGLNALASVPGPIVQPNVLIRGAQAPAEWRRDVRRFCTDPRRRDQRYDHRHATESESDRYEYEG